MTPDEIRQTLAEIKAYFWGCYCNAAEGSSAKALYGGYLHTLNEVMDRIGDKKA
jgi:hypothetical protein